MIRIPVAVLGHVILLIIAFTAGYFVTSEILKALAWIKKRNETYYWKTMQKNQPFYLNEDKIEVICIIGGSIAVGLVISYMFVANVAWFIGFRFTLFVIVVAFYAIIFIGVIVIDKMPETKKKIKKRLLDFKTRKKPSKKHQKRQHKKQADETIGKSTRQKQSVDYQAHIDNIQRNHAEREAVKNDFYSIFSILDNQSQQRGELLEDVINRIFKAYNVPINEPFELIKQNNHDSLEHRLESTIDIAGFLYLVEIIWRNDPVDFSEISYHIVRVFNRNLSGGILITNSEFTQAAITACKQVLSQKTMVLCKAEEIVTLMEQNASLNDLLNDKIYAAKTKQNPLFKPL